LKEGDIELAQNLDGAAEKWLMLTASTVIAWLMAVQIFNRVGLNYNNRML